MALSDYKPKKESVFVPIEGQTDNIEIPLRGLSATDISDIVTVHFNDMDAVYEIYESTGDGEFGELRMLSLISKLITAAPGLIAHVIAVSADEPELVDVASLLPMASQYEAMSKIIALTFTDIATLKKVIADVVSKARELNDLKNLEAK